MRPGHVPEGEEMTINLQEINLSRGTQTREAINEETVAEYAECMKTGSIFPPVVVFHDGSGYLLADGFHRVLAAKRAGLNEIEAEIKTGTRDDALLFSLSANNKHGLRRTNADKRHCIKLALATWPEWSDRRIANICGVSPDTIGRVRRELSESDSCLECNKRIGADGKARSLPTRRDTGPDILPPPGGGLLFLDGKTHSYLKIIPSIHPDFFFYTFLENGPLAQGILHGSKKAMRLDSIREIMKLEMINWTNIERIVLEAGDPLAGPWHYNKEFYFSYQEYLEIALGTKVSNEKAEELEAAADAEINARMAEESLRFADSPVGDVGSG
jgi:hypothetical protein